MKEIKLLEEAKAESSRIGKVIDEVGTREKTYKEKLAGLIKELPDMLARMTLEEGVTRNEVDDIEESIRLLKDRIDEIPVIFRGLKKRELLCQYQVRDATKQIEKLYKSIKDKLKDGDESPALVEQLKAYAPHVGMAEDCSEFLERLNKSK